MLVDMLVVKLDNKCKEQGRYILPDIISTASTFDKLISGTCFETDGKIIHPENITRTLRFGS